MAHPSAPPFLVLHALRLKGLADTGAIARSSGLAEDEVDGHCKSLVDDGHVLRRDGRLCGWSLTKEGRAEHTERVAAELDASGQRGVIDRAYRTFLEANGDMLGACTAWQLRDGDGSSRVINDHTDGAWDASVLDRLQALDRQVQPVLDGFEGALERGGGYRGRFGAALAKVLAGELEWFTRPVIDSYHTVWFELHEDLLCTLGIDRATEAQHVT